MSNILENKNHFGIGEGAASEPLFADTQGSYAVAVGYYAGHCNQGSAAVAVGPESGESNQGVYTVAVGCRAGESNQNNYAVAV